jgi:nucleoside 2-deoxyribosyltransferase
VKNIEICIICGSNKFKRAILEKNKDGIVTKWRYECKYCGNYDVINDEKFLINEARRNFLGESSELDKYLLENIKKNLYKLQSYIRETNDEYNEIPYLTEEKIKTIINFLDKTIQEKFDLLILNLFKFISKDLIWRNISNKIILLRIKSWIKDYYYLHKLIEKAKEEGFIKIEEGNYYDKIYYSDDQIGFADAKLPIIKDFTFKGLEYIETLQQPNNTSKKIFLAFKFDEELNNIFKNTISDMIKSLNLNPVIINQDITSHDEKISDKIIVELKSSRILVADLTYHSQNVCYEIGYAIGMVIPVILTCKKYFLNELAFDINQYPVFEWENEDELKEKIENRIKVLL